METIDQATWVLSAMLGVALFCIGMGIALYFDWREAVQVCERRRMQRIEKLYAAARLTLALATSETVARYYAARIPTAVWA